MLCIVGEQQVCIDKKLSKGVLEAVTESLKNYVGRISGIPPNIVLDRNFHSM